MSYNRFKQKISRSLFSRLYATPFRWPAPARRRSNPAPNPTDPDCYTTGSEFLQGIVWLSKNAPSRGSARHWRAEATAVSRIERLRAAHERTAAHIKSQHPLRLARNADPHALANFRLARPAGVIACEP